MFDSLYYASERGDIPEELGDYYRYMAIRWVLVQKPYMYFLKLPTHDLTQLFCQGKQWQNVVKVLRDPAAALLPIARDVDHVIHAIDGIEGTVLHGDCRENIKLVDFGDRSVTLLNPPTAGNAVFLQSNRVLDALLHNEPQKIDKGEMPADLWRSLVLDSGKHVPEGHLIFSFVGDGAVSWEDGQEVFQALGEVVSTYSFPWHDSTTRNAGLVLIRKGG